jgi:HlyD family secretion protein
MNPRKVIPVLVVAAVILAALVYRFGIARSNHDTPGVIRVSGNIEVTDAEVGFKIPGRVEQRLVDEGMMVQAGQVIALLDKRDLEAEVAMRRAELEAAKALLDELRAGTRPEEVAGAHAPQPHAPPGGF